MKVRSSEECTRIMNDLGIIVCSFGSDKDYSNDKNSKDYLDASIKYLINTQLKILDGFDLNDDEIGMAMSRTSLSS